VACGDHAGPKRTDWQLSLQIRHLRWAMWLLAPEFEMFSMRQVVNNDPSAAVHYKLTVAPSFTDITLAPNEQTLINNIWTQCA